MVVHAISLQAVHDTRCQGLLILVVLHTCSSLEPGSCHAGTANYTCLQMLQGGIWPSTGHASDLHISSSVGSPTGSDRVQLAACIQRLNPLQMMGVQVAWLEHLQRSDKAEGGNHAATTPHDDAQAQQAVHSPRWARCSHPHQSPHQRQAGP